LSAIGSARKRVFSKLTTRVLDSWLAFVTQRAKALFCCPAYRAFPVFRQVFKTGSSRYFVAFVAPVGVVNVAAIDHLATPHILGFSHALLRLLARGGGCGHKALGGRAGGGRRTGNLGKVGVAKFFDMPVNIVVIGQVGLFFVNDPFKETG